MLDVVVILACVCLCVPGFSPMLGQALGRFSLYVMRYMFWTLVQCRGKPEECLYVYVLYVCCYAICIPDFDPMPVFGPIPGGD